MTLLSEHPALWIFAEHARRIAPHEACGAILHNKELLIWDNISPTPELNFIPRIQLDGRDFSEVKILLHSHANDQTYPSREDWLYGYGMGTIQGLYCTQTNQFRFYNGVNQGPLVGRPFVMGVTDCFSLVKDVLETEFGQDAPDYPRWWNYWDEEDLVAKYMYATGYLFKQVIDLEPGDVIVSRIGNSKYANHISVVSKDGHHIYDHRSLGAPVSEHSLSRRVAISQVLLNMAVGFYRRGT